MINQIKEYVMVNQLDDRAGFRPIDAENNRLARQASVMPQAAKGTIENVHLSQTSKQLESLKTLILSAQEINSTKTAFIKEAIAEGRYTVSSDKIAASMLAEVAMI